MTNLGGVVASICIGRFLMRVSITPVQHWSRHISLQLFNWLWARTKFAEPITQLSNHNLWHTSRHILSKYNECVHFVIALITHWNKNLRFYKLHLSLICIKFWEYFKSCSSMVTTPTFEDIDLDGTLYRNLQVLLNWGVPFWSSTPYKKIFNRFRFSIASIKLYHPILGILIFLRKMCKIDTHNVAVQIIFFLRVSTLF